MTDKHTGGCQCKQFFLNGVCEHTATNIPVTPPTESGECSAGSTLTEHCSGCTDPNSEGTHQGCTIEHGHVGCNQSPESGEHTQAVEWEQELRLKVQFDKNQDREVCLLFIRRKMAEAYERGKREREASLHVFLDLLSHGMKHNAKCLREKCHEVLVEIDALLTPPSATNNTEGV